MKTHYVLPNFNLRLRNLIITSGQQTHCGRNIKRETNSVESIAYDCLNFSWAAVQCMKQKRARKSSKTVLLILTTSDNTLKMLSEKVCKTLPRKLSMFVTHLSRRTRSQLRNKFNRFKTTLFLRLHYSTNVLIGIVSSNCNVSQSSLP